MQLPRRSAETNEGFPRRSSEPWLCLQLQLADPNADDELTAACLARPDRSRHSYERDVMQGRELEVRARIVLERHYGCSVELSPPGPDMGRDLIVRHPAGPIVVECKDWSTKKAGRSIVQKLHSATRSMGSRHALLICTSGFTPQARKYAEDLDDIQMELWDGAVFEAVAAKVGVTTDGDSAALGQLVPTEDQFRQLLTMGILKPLAGRLADVEDVTREIKWVAVYGADYKAEGRESRTDREFTRTWSGTVWLDTDSHRVHLGGLPNDGAPLLPAADVIRSSSSVVRPDTTHGEANELMRSYLLGNLAHHESYVGRNNQRYSVTVKPKPSRTSLEAMRTVYVPAQQFHVAGPAGTWTSSFSQVHDNDGRLTGLSIPSDHLGTCAACNGALRTPHLICAVCHRGLHAPLLQVFRLHARRCSECGGYACPEHAVAKENREVRCTTCAPNYGQPVASHLIAPGLVAGAGLLLAVLSGALFGLELAALLLFVSLLPALVEGFASVSRRRTSATCRAPAGACCSR